MARQFNGLKTLQGCLSAKKMKIPEHSKWPLGILQCTRSSLSPEIATLPSMCLPCATLSAPPPVRPRSHSCGLAVPGFATTVIFKGASMPTGKPLTCCRHSRVDARNPWHPDACIMSRAGAASVRIIEDWFRSPQLSGQIPRRRCEVLNC